MVRKCGRVPDGGIDQVFANWGTPVPLRKTLTVDMILFKKKGGCAWAQLGTLSLQKNEKGASILCKYHGLPLICPCIVASFSFVFYYCKV